METKQAVTTYPMGQWVNQKEELKKYLERNDNENITIQKFGDAAKAVLRGKRIAIHAFLRKGEKPQINNLPYHLKEAIKETTKAKARNGKEVKNFREEINKIDIQKNRKNH